MKSLLVLRHAKSSWSDASLSDHQRPLNKRGKRDAPRMGELLLEQDMVPDRILASTAVRALTTAQIVAEFCNFDGEVDPVREFYMASPRDYLLRISQVEDDAARVMVVGHNPGMEQLVAVCSGEYVTMPTAALALITFETDDWAAIADTAGALQQVWRPKEL